VKLTDADIARIGAETAERLHVIANETANVWRTVAVAGGAVGYVATVYIKLGLSRERFVDDVGCVFDGIAKTLKDRS
jgi:Na+/alanine symporter